jgi:hypothetical protein
MKLSIYPIISFLIIFVTPATAAVPGFTLLPKLTAYLECQATTCTKAQLRSKAKQDAKSRGNGDYQYLLGNVATGELDLVNIFYEAPIPSQGEPGFLVLIQAATPSNYVAQFGQYVTTAGAGPLKANAPPSIPRLPNDIGGMADLSTYLRGLPQFSNIFFDAGHPIITVTFQDGSSAQFVLLSPTAEPGLAFGYVPGSAKDKNGNPISDQDLINSNPNSGNIIGTNYAGWANLSGGYLIIVGVVVHVDWQTMGTVKVSSICDSEGNCYYFSVP